MVNFTNTPINTTFEISYYFAYNYFYLYILDMTTMIDYSVNQLSFPEEAETFTQKSQYIRGYTKDIKFTSHELILHEYINIYRLYKCDPELLEDWHKRDTISQLNTSTFSGLLKSTRVRNALSKHAKKLLRAVKVKKYNTKGWTNEEFYEKAKRITEELE
jgi:hypothetical protein